MRKLIYLGTACVLLVLVALAICYGMLRASLPQLDGQVRGPGLTAQVRITRDSLGVPTIEAANRLDLAFGTGFVHAQDRFFQMDLARRLAAGELAELFGTVALQQDERTRMFRFRALAGRVLAQADAGQRALLEAYARGVNAGLAGLGGRPWEYWVLGTPPAAWRTEDTVLVAYAMWWDLQADDWNREILRQEVNERLGGKVCADGSKCALAFLYPARTVWDAPDGTDAPAPPAPIPPPDALNIRSPATPGPALPATPATTALERRRPDAGSNNWALAGWLTRSGAALVANDMHLSQRVPPIWYHARLRITGGGPGAAPLDLIGVTLPGAPLLIAGSNTHIAWGFTNSDGNWVSVTHVPCTSVDEREVETPSGSVPLAVARELIHVKGGADTELDVRTGAAGVLLRAEPQRHSCWFVAWLAQLPEATNLNLMELEGATSVAQALQIAPGVGTPHQNLVVGDRDGHIGWTIIGRVPADTGAGRAIGGAPWTTSANQPHLVDPPLGRIWSANARVTADEHEAALIGGAEAPYGARYDLGARARQIRNDLLHVPGNATPADMLKIQLDDRALFLVRWREVLLHVIDAAGVRDNPQRAELRRLVSDWDARADVPAVGYRVVRAFHDRTQAAVWDMLLTGLGVPADYNVGAPSQFEAPLWQIVTAQPPHLLASSYPDWKSFLRAQLEATLADLARSCPELARCTWGEHNTVRVRHPLSRALPWLARLLDMPVVELPGDHDMPRVQDGAFGASERFAVSPGHESEGYFHMPGGQSGHPLSPYYRAGFAEWARGEPLPFLPGATRHTLTLAPQ